MTDYNGRHRDYYKHPIYYWVKIRFQKYFIILFLLDCFGNEFCCFIIKRILNVQDSCIVVSFWVIWLQLNSSFVILKTFLELMQISK